MPFRGGGDISDEVRKAIDVLMRKAGIEDFSFEDEQEVGTAEADEDEDIIDPEFLVHYPSHDVHAFPDRVVCATDGTRLTFGTRYPPCGWCQQNPATLVLTAGTRLYGIGCAMCLPRFLRQSAGLSYESRPAPWLVPETPDEPEAPAEIDFGERASTYALALTRKEEVVPDTDLDKVDPNEWVMETSYSGRLVQVVQVGNLRRMRKVTDENFGDVTEPPFPFILPDGLYEGALVQTMDRIYGFVLTDVLVMPNEHEMAHKRPYTERRAIIEEHVLPHASTNVSLVGSYQPCNTHAQYIFERGASVVLKRKTDDYEGVRKEVTSCPATGTCQHHAASSGAASVRSSTRPPQPARRSTATRNSRSATGGGPSRRTRSRR